MSSTPPNGLTPTIHLKGGETMRSRYSYDLRDMGEKFMFTAGLIVLTTAGLAVAGVCIWAICKLFSVLA